MQSMGLLYLSHESLSCLCDDQCWIDIAVAMDLSIDFDYLKVHSLKLTVRT